MQLCAEAPSSGPLNTLTDSPKLQDCIQLTPLPQQVTSGVQHLHLPLGHIQVVFLIKG